MKESDKSNKKLAAFARASYEQGVRHGLELARDLLIGTFADEEFHKKLQENFDKFEQEFMEFWDKRSTDIKEQQGETIDETLQ